MYLKRLSSAECSFFTVVKALKSADHIRVMKKLRFFVQNLIDAHHSYDCIANRWRNTSPKHKRKGKIDESGIASNRFESYFCAIYSILLDGRPQLDHASVKALVHYM